MADVFINGMTGRLEAVYQQGFSADAPLVLVMHPNPQTGGSMNNKVVYTLFQTFVKLGFSVLRFNCRGVGKSQGIVDGLLESQLADALSALDWLRYRNPEAMRLWLAGYAEGANVLFSILTRRPDIDGFIAVSPIGEIEDLAYLTPCPSSGVIVHAGLDGLVEETALTSVAERLNASGKEHVDFLVVSGADHDYTGQLKSLHESLLEKIPAIMARRKRVIKKKKV